MEWTPESQTRSLSRVGPYPPRSLSMGGGRGITSLTWAGLADLILSIGSKGRGRGHVAYQEMAAAEVPLEKKPDPPLGTRRDQPLLKGSKGRPQLMPSLGPRVLKAKLCLTLCAALFCLASLRTSWTGRREGTGMASHPHTLVMYIFSDSDPEAINNLRYFVRHAVREGDGCEYVIVVQQGKMKGQEIDSQQEPKGAGGLCHPDS